MDPFHVRGFTQQELTETLAQTGLESIKRLGLHPRSTDGFYFAATDGDGSRHLLERGWSPVPAEKHSIRK